jgi:hypothetical protein
MALRVPKGKKAILVYIDEKVAEKLYLLVRQKYGNLTGGLSNEVEESLRNWLGLHMQHTNAQKIKEVNPIPKTFTIFQQVKNYLKNKYFDGITPQQVPLSLIREAIEVIRGSDKRTVEKWLKEFAKWKLIKEIAPQIFELM